MSTSPKSSEKGESPRTTVRCNEEEVDVRQAGKSPSCARHRGGAANIPHEGPALLGFQSGQGETPWENKVIQGFDRYCGDKARQGDRDVMEGLSCQEKASLSGNI